MDVASTFAVSIAPPPYQKEVDEARRDTQNRTSIPQLNESHSSERQAQIGNRRGSTDGSNSLLSAQQAGMLDAEDEIVVDKDGRKKRRRRQGQGRGEGDGESGQGGSHDREASYAFDGHEYAQDAKNGKPLDGHLDDPVKAGYDPITGYYEIPATSRTPRRSILLRFREQNVHFLERFSDKSTAVGLINFALCRRYGSIIPHCRLGQVVEKRT